MCLSVRATPTLFGSKVPRHSGRSLELDLQIVHPRGSFRTQTTIKQAWETTWEGLLSRAILVFGGLTHRSWDCCSITHLLEYITCACTHVCTFAHRGGWCGGVKYHSLKLHTAWCYAAHSSTQLWCYAAEGWVGWGSGGGGCSNMCSSCTQPWYHSENSCTQLWRYAAHVGGFREELADM